MIKSGHSVLDEDGRLSSASAATSLKYAKAQDLPSFPSVGLKMASAGAAASLADSNKKAFEHWRPGDIPAANKAALLAKDYEMDPLWQPELSTAGSKAALLAHRDPPQVELPEVTISNQGQSAAGQALRAKTIVKPMGGEVSADARQKALMAATGAMSGSRPRAGSTPVAQTSDSKSWAMKAAAKSHQASTISQPFASGDPGFEAARIQNLAKNNVNRQLFGSTPPVSIEVEEKQRQDMLRASAVAMAQKMYAIQQSHPEDAAGTAQSDSRVAATNSHRRNTSNVSTTSAEHAPPPRYENLEEAARKLAQERLAKLHDEHAEYRSYYGAKSPPPQSRLSMRLRGRRASTGNESDSDEEQSRKIRQQMSLFTSKLAEVDKSKRQADRDRLLEVAHRNVEARMNKMDEQVFQETGKASPAQRELWERQARERAQKQVDLQLQNVGKVHIGGGRYLEREEVDAIAKARLQPTLDEISDRAEKQRARDEEIRLDQERLAAEAATRKARDVEIKAEHKAVQEREKQEAKSKKEEEKRREKEQAQAAKERTRLEKEQKQAEQEAEKEKARLEKEQRRKSKDIKSGRFSSILRKKSVSAGAEPERIQPSRDVQIDAGSAPITTQTESTVHDRVTTVRPSSQQSESLTDEQPNDTTLVTGRNVEGPPTSPSKRDSRVKSWFKSHLRGAGKTSKDDVTADGAESGEHARDGSLRDVALAGRTHESQDLYGSSDATHTSPVAAGNATSDRSPSISSLSSSEPPTETADVPTSHAGTPSDHKGKGLKTKLLSKLKPQKDEAGKLRKTNTTEDEFEEARDTFEEKLTPPTGLGEQPRTSHEGSKFKEEL